MKSNVSIIMLGTGSPRPDLERSGPAQLLLIDDIPILIDCGDCVTTQLIKAGIPLSAITLFGTGTHEGGNFIWH
jgi:ribonuclease BN (tRNA processing enzyme)